MEKFCFLLFFFCGGGQKYLGEKICEIIIFFINLATEIFLKEIQLFLLISPNSNTYIGCVWLPCIGRAKRQMVHRRIPPSPVWNTSWQSTPCDLYVFQYFWRNWDSCYVEANVISIHWNLISIMMILTDHFLISESKISSTYEISHVSVNMNYLILSHTINNYLSIQ